MSLPHTYDSKAGEMVGAPEDRACHHPVPGVPQREPVPKQILSRPDHFEIQLDLPIPDTQRHLLTLTVKSMQILVFDLLILI